eukprot:3314559-Rhodomonas_salina.3
MGGGGEEDEKAELSGERAWIPAVEGEEGEEEGGGARSERWTGGLVGLNVGKGLGVQVERATVGDKTCVVMTGLLGAGLRRHHPLHVSCVRI